MNALNAAIQLVDLAACLSICANTESSRELAARKRDEAWLAIREAETELAHCKAILAMFPRPNLDKLTPN